MHAGDIALAVVFYPRPYATALMQPGRRGPRSTYRRPHPARDARARGTRRLTCGLDDEQASRVSRHGLRQSRKALHAAAIDSSPPGTSTAPSRPSGSGQVAGGNANLRVSDATRRTPFARRLTANPCDVLTYRLLLSNPGPRPLSHVRIAASINIVTPYRHVIPTITVYTPNVACHRARSGATGGTRRRPLRGGPSDHFVRHALVGVPKPGAMRRAQVGRARCGRA